MKNWKLLLELIRKKAESKSTGGIKKEAGIDTTPSTLPLAARNTTITQVNTVSTTVSTTAASPVQHLNHMTYLNYLLKL